MEIKKNIIHIPEVGMKIFVDEDEKSIRVIRDGKRKTYELGIFIYTDENPDPEYSESTEQLFVVPFECVKTTFIPYDEGYSGAPTSLFRIMDKDENEVEIINRH